MLPTLLPISAIFWLEQKGNKKRKRKKTTAQTHATTGVYARVWTVQTVNVQTENLLLSLLLLLYICFYTWRRPILYFYSEKWLGFLLFRNWNASQMHWRWSKMVSKWNTSICLDIKIYDRTEKRNEYFYIKNPHNYTHISTDTGKNHREKKVIEKRKKIFDLKGEKLINRRQMRQYNQNDIFIVSTV